MAEAERKTVDGSTERKVANHVNPAAYNAREGPAIL
jgi:hypothetical protein